MSKYGIISNRRARSRPRLARSLARSLLAAALAIYHEGLVRAGVMAVWPLMILDIQRGINHCLCLYYFLPAMWLFGGVFSLFLPWQIAYILFGHYRR